MTFHYLKYVINQKIYLRRSVEDIEVSSFLGVLQGGEWHVYTFLYDMHVGFWDSSVGDLWSISGCVLIGGAYNYWLLLAVSSLPWNCNCF